MATRRMFSKKVIDTDRFLDMPSTTQMLYFHLSLRADDDGFISAPKRIMRMIGSSDDDLKLLIAKEFVIPFESGVCVIKHWRVHNYIQKDRYQETFHKYEKSLLHTDKGNDNEYVLMDTECIQNDSKMFPQVRLGKDRLELGKVSKGKSKESKKETSAKAPAPAKRNYGEFVLLTVEQYDKLIDKLGHELTLSYIERLDNYIGSKGKRYKSHYHTILNWCSKDVEQQAKGQAQQYKQPYNKSDAKMDMLQKLYAQAQEEEQKQNKTEVLFDE